jgi:hypothetical protein
MIRAYGARTGQNTKTYFAATTDSILDYPTDCESGSTLTTIDESTHVWAKIYSFDGTNWNLIADFTEV